ncbi:MAG TPA: malate synthase A [Gemmatimonadaceae bacterium]|nr:malate synthase A [Gemmatimonadaceae bacterium]
MSPASAAAQPLVHGPATRESHRVLTPDALAFVGRLHAEFADRRLELLRRRQERWEELRAGRPLAFGDGPATRADWKVAPAPADLNDRRVEITGPAEAKMMINALNSGASVFMADLEDALSPTWSNVVDGQGALMDAVRRTLTFTSPEGKRYELKERLATLVVRPRGWHLEEAHVSFGGRPASASLFDFGLCFFHNARAALERGSGPYFYLPKMESHLEARLWNDVFVLAQDALGIPRGTIRATMLVETIYAAFEMEEILYELREHAAGLNAGRWDYLFSVIKAFRTDPAFVLPDRSQLTMAVPFMRAYAQRLVQVCHRHGAHAIGGMAAFVPSRRDADVNAVAMGKVREDKDRESGDGFDGTWVAHPDLVPVAREVFDKVLKTEPNQKSKVPDVTVTAEQLLDTRVAGAKVTRAGVRTNIDVALQYLDAWLRGTGAVAIHNLMEDAATAEISRSQLWQWVTHRVDVDGSGTMGAHTYREVRDEVVAELRQSAAADSRLDDAVSLLDELVLGEWQDFLTIPGYQRLDRQQ